MENDLNSLHQSRYTDNTTYQEWLQGNTRVFGIHKFRTIR